MEERGKGDGGRSPGGRNAGRNARPTDVVLGGSNVKNSPNSCGLPCRGDNSNLLGGVPRLGIRRGSSPKRRPQSRWIPDGTCLPIFHGTAPVPVSWPSMTWKSLPPPKDFQGPPAPAISLHGTQKRGQRPLPAPASSSTFRRTGSTTRRFVSDSTHGTNRPLRAHQAMFGGHQPHRTFGPSRRPAGPAPA